MKKFYKIMSDGFLSLGSGLVVPSGYSEDFSILELDVNKELYSHYNQDGTPNLVGIAKAEQEVANKLALEYLASTDWYITRLMETSVAVPPEILTAREEARASIVV